MSRRRRRSGGLWRQAQSLIGSMTSIGVGLALIALVWTTVQVQRLVGLRHQCVLLQEDLGRERVLLGDARAAMDRAFSYESIAPRARVELGLIDSDPSTRSFVSLPAPAVEPQSSVFMRMADGIDRFANVRDSWAAEEKR